MPPVEKDGYTPFHVEFDHTRDTVGKCVVDDPGLHLSIPLYFANDECFPERTPTFYPSMSASLMGFIRLHLSLKEFYEKVMMENMPFPLNPVRRRTSGHLAGRPYSDYKTFCLYTRAASDFIYDQEPLNSGSPGPFENNAREITPSPRKVSTHLLPKLIISFTPPITECIPIWTLMLLSLMIIIFMNMKIIFSLGESGEIFDLFHLLLVFLGITG